MLIKKENMEKIQQRIETNTVMAMETMRQYGIITDQYMNGDIAVPIGKEQARLQKLHDKSLSQIKKDKNKLQKMLDSKKSNEKETLEEDEEYLEL